MTPTKRRSFRYSGLDFQDHGILVKEAMELIRKSEFYDEIATAFNLDEIKNEFIEIKGAKHLVNTLIAADEEFEKIDVDTSFENVKLHKYTDDNQIILEISNIQDKSILAQTKTDIIYPQSIYSVCSEYLGMFGIDKYLEYCKAKGYHDIIDVNIEMFNQKITHSQKTKKFRLLKKFEDYYIRAITSTEVYKDYNLRFSLFVALIELHNLIKSKGHSFYVESYNLNESDLTVLFKSSHTVTVSENTKIGFAFELVNDEIKRDAVKFNGLFSVDIANKEIFAKPIDAKKYNLISFSHSIGLDKVKHRLSNLNASMNTFIADTVEDAKKIKVLKKPDLFREYMLLKVLNSKNNEFNKNYREEAKRILSNKVNTIFELATIFEKIELLIEDEHISSLEFWRYKLYQVLMDGVRNRN